MTDKQFKELLNFLNELIVVAKEINLKLKHIVEIIR